MDQIESVAQCWKRLDIFLKVFLHYTLQCNIIFMPIIKTCRKFYLYFTPQQFITVTNEPVTKINKLKW